MVQLPLKSVHLGYRQEKVRLASERMLERVQEGEERNGDQDGEK